MDYEKTKQTMMTAYPSLFVDEIDVLHHLFFVCGNGYDWLAGELTNGETSEETIRIARENRRLFAEQLPACVTSGSDDPEIERTKTRERRLRAFERGSDYYFRRPNRTIGYKLYPLGEYADIMHVPDDVRPDWLEAARRAVGVARTEFRPTPEDEEWLAKAEARLLALMCARFGK